MKSAGKQAAIYTRRGYERFQRVQVGPGLGPGPDGESRSPMSAHNVGDIDGWRISVRILRSQGRWWVLATQSYTQHVAKGQRQRQPVGYVLFSYQFINHLLRTIIELFIGAPGHRS